MKDVIITSTDWNKCKNKKLFFIPAIHQAYTAGTIVHADLVEQGQVTAPTAAAVCNLKPVSYKTTVPVLKQFEKVTGQKLLPEQEIRSAVFRVKQFDDLFSEEVMARYGIDKANLVARSGLHSRTVDNFLLRGRVTAHVVKSLLETYQTLFKETGAGLSEQVTAFVATEDLRDYVTTAPGIPHLAVMQDKNDDYLRHDGDMAPAPVDWTDWN